MKVWLLWTHYDCDVYATLFSTRLEAYQYLATGWLEDCDEDNCGHDSLDTIEEIGDALEYHYEDLSYSVEEHIIPMGSLPPPDPSEVVIVPDKPVIEPIVVTADQTGGLLSALESFSHE